MYVFPFFDAVNEPFCKLAWHAIGVHFAFVFNDVGVVAHSAFETFHDFGVVRVKQGVYPENDVVFDEHIS